MSGSPLNHIHLSAQLTFILDPTIRWIHQHAPHLLSPSSPCPLAFYLHRSTYLTLLLTPPAPTSRPSAIPPPILYAQTHLSAFLPNHLPTISRLITANLFLPASKLAASPYADLLDDGLHQTLLVPMFESEFCRWAGWPEKEVLGVAVGVGANSAVGRIEKGRKVMKERVGESWKMGDELPVSTAVLNPPDLCGR